MLCCIGDVVEDVVAWLTTEIAYGTDTNVEIHRRRGGSAANVAVAAVAAGAAVRFIGKVGSDSAGDALVAQLERDGVEVFIERGGRTGTIIVLVDPTGERTMLPDRAAAADLSHIDDVALVGVDWLHIPAYSLVDGSIAETSKDAIARIVARGGRVSIDASSVAIISEVGPARFRETLAGLGPDVVLCNADEGALLGIGDGPGLDGVGLTVVKSGAQGASAYDTSGLVAFEPAVSIDHVRDTTGAGDAFAAGFIVAMMAEAGVAGALKGGHASAAGVLTRLSP